MSRRIREMLRELERAIPKPSMTVFVSINDELVRPANLDDGEWDEYQADHNDAVARGDMLTVSIGGDADEQRIMPAVEEQLQ